MNQKIEAPTLEHSDMVLGLLAFYDKANNIVDSNSTYKHINANTAMSLHVMYYDSDVC